MSKGHGKDETLHRHLGLFRLTGDLLDGCFADTPEGKAWRVGGGIPHGARTVGIYFEASPAFATLVLEHNSFPGIEQGENLAHEICLKVSYVEVK